MRGKKSPACQRLSRAAEPAGFLRDPFRTSRDASVKDVGIPIDLVGVCMMGIVFANPPSKAQSDQRVPDAQPQQSVSSTGPKNLLMSHVMGDEGQLSEHQTKKNGDANSRP